MTQLQEASDTPQTNGATPIFEEVTVFDASVDLQQEVKRNKPFIVRNYCPEISKYNLNFLKEHYSDHDTEILWEEEHSTRYNQVISHYKPINIGDYIKMIEEDEELDLYLEQENINDGFPGLKKKLPISELRSFGIECVVNCWVGPKATQSTLHYDGDHNFLIQAQGSKEIDLIDPQYTQDLYPKSVSFYDGFSEVDCTDPDYEKYPRFENVKIARETLHPGDILFMPAGWWHDVRSLDISVSYNVWWLHYSDFLKYLAKETWHRTKGLVGLAPPMEVNQSYYHMLRDKITNQD